MASGSAGLTRWWSKPASLDPPRRPPAPTRSGPRSVVPRTRAAPAAAWPPRSRPCPAGRCPAGPPRAGTPRPPSRASGPSWATRTSWPVEPGSSLARLPAASTLSSTTRMRRRGTARRRPRRSSRRAGRPPGPSGAGAGRRTRCPGPGPRSRAATLPPCISTRLLTSVSPIPRPALGAVQGRPTWANRSKMAAEHLRRDPDARVPHADDRLAPVAAGGQVDAAAGRRCTWRRCSAGS